MEEDGQRHGVDRENAPGGYERCRSNLEELQVLQVLVAHMPLLSTRPPAAAFQFNVVLAS